MVVYSDSLIHLEFDPKTEILKVKWPHLVDEPMLIVRPTFSKIFETIKYFNVSKLLVDTKNSDTNIPAEDFRKLSHEFVEILAASNINMLARIIYAQPQREIRAKILTDELSHRLGSTFKSREFEAEKSALLWLKSDEN
jgi:hypothetical protein